MFSIVYAIPCGGRREFFFKDASQLANHVQANRPALFVGVPQYDDNYETKMESYRKHSYRLPDER